MHPNVPFLSFQKCTCLPRECCGHPPWQHSVKPSYCPRFNRSRVFRTEGGARNTGLAQLFSTAEFLRQTPSIWPTTWNTYSLVFYGKSFPDKWKTYNKYIDQWEKVKCGFTINAFGRKYYFWEVSRSEQWHWNKLETPKKTLDNKWRIRSYW